MADTDEEAAKHKAAIATLRGATKAMEAALERNRVLECALQVAGDNLRYAKNYVGQYAYTSSGSGREGKRLTDVLEEQAQAALKHVS